MILIEVNNKTATSNFELLERTEKWANKSIKGQYTAVLNPHLEQEIRITYHDHGNSNNAPHGTNTLSSDSDSDNTIWSS